MAEFDKDTIANMRRSYGESGLSESEIDSNPIQQFRSWLKDAAENPIVIEANAMVLSTVVDSQPTSRTVLLKDVTEAGFTFFTNYNSAKSTAITGNEKVSLLFPWYPLERQVKILGSASKISDAESDAYFATRPWSSKIGAWASDQSAPLSSRTELESKWSEFAAKYPEGSEVPRPSHWGGFLVTPISIEFWQGRYSRLHDRIRYTKTGSEWKIQRIYP
ncbi:MAG: pyridoxamine 5'-phosphate oxidase [Actinobacteria bacterium]|nr:pyridoxamine 5'-phosphate oxidase [Actinomycetota bacterium]